MGSGSSSPKSSRSRTPPPPPPQPLTTEPWRKSYSWSEDQEKTLQSDIKKLKPEFDKRPNLITIGPVGAGKSSFINSILSIGKGEKCISAKTGDASSSFTKEFKTFIQGSLLEKYRLMDCMGIEPTDGEGFHPDDIIALLKGHVNNGYSFKKEKPISESDPSWRSDPQFEHQIHCVIFVVDASTIHAGIPHAYVQKIKQLQEKIRQADIPRILVLTKVDRLCNEVRKDIRNICRSVRVRDAVKIASEVFGIDKGSIHPVKNYEDELELDPITNIPLLLAVRQAMRYALHKVEEMLHPDDF